MVVPKEEMKEGRKAKDAPITEGFNKEKLSGMKKSELKSAEKQAKKAMTAEERQAAKDDLKNFMAGLENEENDKSAYQMLQDMRWVYRKVAGRKKLHSLIKDDDKQFVFMVKELMKIEAQLLSAKIRAKDDSQVQGQQTVFVVLKGLEDGPKIAIETKDGDVDLRQVASILTPEGKEYDA